MPDDLAPVPRAPDAPGAKGVPVVLGIDPGTRRTGYGALSAQARSPALLSCGVIGAPARLPIAARLGRLHAGIEELLHHLNPDVLALEGAFFARNPRSALRLGEARGVVLALAARAGLEVVEIAPAEAKKAVIGHGGATKEQIAATMATILGIGPAGGGARHAPAVPDGLPHDAADALAIAYACVRRLSMPPALRGARSRR